MTPARPVVLAVAVGAVGALALASCESLRPSACPGDPLATLRVQAELLTDGGTNAGACPLGPGNEVTGLAGIDRPAFTVVLTTSDDGTARACAQRPEAQPLVGTLQGDVLEVKSAAKTPANAPACKCAVEVEETLAVTLARDGDGLVTGFTGTLRDDLAPAPTDGGPPACEPAPTADGGLPCGVPCAATWNVTAAR